MSEANGESKDLRLFFAHLKNTAGAPSILRFHRRMGGKEPSPP
jgi:hypothetical protein